mmetsp:Transcript_18044/g.23748  ORF Transcript_18044/g.23748 Transcript_18044/m.23748 type:complete len:931 (-) Transcript_18044:129-2921(-)
MKESTPLRISNDSDSGRYYGSQDIENRKLLEETPKLELQIRLEKTPRIHTLLFIYLLSVFVTGGVIFSFPSSIILLAKDVYVNVLQGSVTLAMLSGGAMVGGGAVWLGSKQYHRAHWGLACALMLLAVLLALVPHTSDLVGPEYALYLLFGLAFVVGILLPVIFYCTYILSLRTQWADRSYFQVQKVAFLVFWPVLPTLQDVAGLAAEYYSLTGACALVAFLVIVAGPPPPWNKDGTSYKGTPGARSHTSSSRSAFQSASAPELQQVSSKTKLGRQKSTGVSNADDDFYNTPPRESITAYDNESGEEEIVQIEKQDQSTNIPNSLTPVTTLRRQGSGQMDPIGGIYYGTTNDLDSPRADTGKGFPVQPGSLGSFSGKKRQSGILRQGSNRSFYSTDLSGSFLPEKKPPARALAAGRRFSGPNSSSGQMPVSNKNMGAPEAITTESLNDRTSVSSSKEALGIPGPSQSVDDLEAGLASSPGSSPRQQGASEISGESSSGPVSTPQRGRSKSLKVPNYPFSDRTPSPPSRDRETTAAFLSMQGEPVQPEYGPRVIRKRKRQKGPSRIKSVAEIRGVPYFLAFFTTKRKGVYGVEVRCQEAFGADRVRRKAFFSDKAILELLAFEPPPGRSMTEHAMNNNEKIILSMLSNPKTIVTSNKPHGLEQSEGKSRRLSETSLSSNVSSASTMSEIFQQLEQRSIWSFPGHKKSQRLSIIEELSIGEQGTDSTIAGFDRDVVDLTGSGSKVILLGELLVAVMLFFSFGGVVTTASYLGLYAFQAGIVSASQHSVLLIYVFLPGIVGQAIALYNSHYENIDQLYRHVACLLALGVVLLFSLLVIPYEQAAVFWIFLAVFGFITGVGSGLFQALWGHSTQFTTVGSCLIFISTCAGCGIVPVITFEIWQETLWEDSLIVLNIIAQAVPLALLFIAHCLKK